MTHEVNENERFLRLPEVLSKVGISKATLYDKIKRGEFPGPIKLFGGPNVAWRQSDILAWMQEQILEQAK